MKKQATKLLPFLMMLFLAPVTAMSEEIPSTFFGCMFGKTAIQVAETLKKGNIEADIHRSGNAFLKNTTLLDVEFSTVCLMISPIDGVFYKAIGSNNFEDKDQAKACYEKNVSLMRDRFPNLQILRVPEGALKMCTYMNDENAFYLGLFKSKDEKGKTIYYVNLNIWNKFFQDNINEAAKKE